MIPDMGLFQRMIITSICHLLRRSCGILSTFGQTTTPQCNSQFNL